MASIKNKLLYTFILCGTFWLSTAQESMVEDENFIEPPKMTVLDSIKKSFVKYDKVAKIDNLWLKELASASEITPDSTMRIDSLNIDEEVAFDLPVEVLKARLKKLDEKSPFDIEYNPALENVIKSDRKSTRLNSSHVRISYAVFCLKKKKKKIKKKKLQTKTNTNAYYTRKNSIKKQAEVQKEV